MRIRINFTKNTTPVSINNQSLVNGYIHKCLGVNNPFHDAKNDYCISSLQGGKLNISDNTLTFDKGGFITVTSLNSDFINKILIGILSNTDFIHGMKFAGIDYINESFINGWNHFATLSPFLIKKSLGDKKCEFITLKSDNFEKLVKEYLIKKLTAINSTLDLTNFDVKGPNHPSHKVKSILVKHIISRANQCQISIHTNKKVAELLYNIGLGQSTGSGFGTIYKTENQSKYLVK